MARQLRSDRHRIISVDIPEQVRYSNSRNIVRGHKGGIGVPNSALGLSSKESEARTLKQKKKSSNGRTLARLLHGSWRCFAACIAASLLFTLCELIIPQIIRVSVDSLIGQAPVKSAAARPIVEALGGAAYLRQNLWVPAVFMAGLGLLSAMMRYCVNIYSSKAGETLVKTSRDLLYHHIQHLPWKWHMQNPTGDIIQRCTSDVERIKTFFEEQFVSVFRAVAMIVFALVCMALMNWKLALVPAVMFPIIIVYSLLFHNSIRERYTACDESEGVLSTIAQENLTGVRVVRAFGREEYERQRFEKQNEDYTTLWVRLCRTLSDFWAVGDATACIQTMLVVLIGSILCVRGEMTEGEFVSFAIYNTMSISPVRRLGRVISEMSKAGVSVSRIGEILDAPCEQDRPDAKELPMDGDIVFDHVSFRYETGPDVLSDVSFTIPAGLSFGILGGTGSGKSSLLLMLCRLYAPSEGRVTVGGEDLADMPAAWVRDHVGVVLQEPFLFSRTIEENIGICGADRETVRSAAATACIASDIEQFANGYDTMVGERGVTLSGGQKQRVAIARMLTKKTPVMVFDDSLSAVDTQTDEHIREALNRDLAGTTTIIISHRITTLMDCGNILVLEHGKVLQRGTPQELLRQPGLFRQIYDMQMSIGEEEPA